MQGQEETSSHSYPSGSRGKSPPPLAMYLRCKSAPYSPCICPHDTCLCSYQPATGQTRTSRCSECISCGQYHRVFGISSDEETRFSVLGWSPGNSKLLGKTVDIFCVFQRFQSWEFGHTDRGLQTKISLEDSPSFELVSPNDAELIRQLMQDSRFR